MTPVAQRPPVLPPPLVAVRIPDRISPSGFVALCRCPLSQLHGLGERERLPPDATALFGTVLHETTARLRTTLSGDLPDRDEILAVFAEVVREAEEGARRDWPGAMLVPLSQAVGRTRWRQGRARLLAWVAAARTAPYLRTPGDGTAPPVRHGSARRIPFGRERRVDVPELRLSGRPDLVEFVEGTVHVTDLKSGRVLHGGVLRREHAWQLWLYALMLESLEPGVRIRLWLQGADRVEVPWTDRERAATRRRLDDLLVCLPAGHLVEAAKLASPGEHCRLCRVRHRCVRYRTEAVSWWGRTSSVRPVAPYDTWGEPTGRPLPSGPVDDRKAFRDAAGRTVLVAGASRVSFAPGERAWFFGLLPDETPLHGRHVHPRNFMVRGDGQVGNVPSGIYRSEP